MPLHRARRAKGRRASPLRWGLRLCESSSVNLRCVSVNRHRSRWNFAPHTFLDLKGEGGWAKKQEKGEGGRRRGLARSQHLLPVPRGRWHPSPASPPAPRSLLCSTRVASPAGTALCLELFTGRWFVLSPHLLSHGMSIRSAFCLLTFRSSLVFLPQAPSPLASPDPTPPLPYPGGLLSCTICSPASQPCPSPPSPFMPSSLFCLLGAGKQSRDAVGHP